MHVDMYTEFILSHAHSAWLKISMQSPLTDRRCLLRVPGLPQYGDSYLKVVAEPVPSPSLDPCAELLFSAYAPYIGLAEATCRSS